MNNEISIKRAVLHVLDMNAAIPVLSGGELEIEGDLEEYLANHIDKIQEDPNTKSAAFTVDENEILSMCRVLSENEDEFLAVTTEIAGRLFNFMQKHVDIPSADLVFCIFEMNGTRYLGFLKMNYKAGFTHWVQSAEEGNINTIVRHKTLLPQEGQKLEECILVNLSDFRLRLMEKQYEIDGEKEYYLSMHFLKCDCNLSDNAKLKILDKATKKINKKYFDEDFEKAIKLKQAVTESFEETAAIQVEKVADKLFDRDVSIQREYVEEIAKAGLSESEIKIPDKLIEKKFKTHRIKTDNGIEIDFPLEYAGNRDKIEFVNNTDGTISIIIKNIGRIMNK